MPSKSIKQSVSKNSVGNILSIREMEREHIRQVMAHCETLLEAATILGINLSTLWRKRREYGLA